MEKRRIGKAGPETSVIGFGCMTLGKGPFGFTDENEAIVRKMMLIR